MPEIIIKTKFEIGQQVRRKPSGGHRDGEMYGKVDRITITHETSASRQHCVIRYGVYPALRRTAVFVAQESDLEALNAPAQDLGHNNDRKQ